MAFIKNGVAPISEVKCGCGQNLQATQTSCPNCGKNLRPLSNPTANKPAPVKDPEEGNPRSC